MKRALVPPLLLLATAPWLGCIQYLFGGWADHQAAGSVSGSGGEGGGTGGMGGGTGGADGCMPGETVPCYDGPAGTEGIGLCKEGSKTCTEDGSGFGPCVGAVLPQLENCATPQDEDCDGLAPACKGNLLWAEHFGDANSAQYPRSIAVDGVGNVLITGSFGGTLNLGGGSFASSAGSVALFVAKFDPSGAHVWSKSFGDGGYEEGRSIAVDASGNVLITGYFDGTIDLGGGPLVSAGGYDLFIAKFDPSGAHVWSKSFGIAGSQQGQAVAVDASGNVLITGRFSGAMDLGGGPLAYVSGYDLFVAKFDPSGAHVWSKSFGAAGDQQVQAIAVDASGNVLITGYFDGTMSLGGGPLAYGGGSDLFVAKFDPSGAHVWSKSFGDASDQQGQAIAVDASGNVLVTGHFDGKMSLGDMPLVSAGGFDLFVAKFDPSGAHMWSKSFGDGGFQEGRSLVVDAPGSVLVTGRFNGVMNLGSGQLVSAGGYDLFVAKLDPSGGPLWSKSFGDVSLQEGHGIAVDASGNVLTTGRFSGTMDFGLGPLTSAGFDLFVAKLTP